MKLRAAAGSSVALAFFLKDRTGGLRPARRLTFVHAATKVSKNAFTPCGGHLLCRDSEKSITDTALKAGPLQEGLPLGVTYKGKA